MLSAGFHDLQEKRHILSSKPISGAQKIHSQEVLSCVIH